MNPTVLPSEGDISFRADDFLMGSDEFALVDFVDDDEVNGRDDAEQINQRTATKPNMNSTALPSEGDLSFGADDFLMGSDELALEDFMDDSKVKSRNDAEQINQQTETKPNMKSTALPSEGDVSFGADNFLMGSDGLAHVDFMDDDEVKGNDENELTLSWFLTPPKDPKSTTQASISSQISQNRAPSQPIPNPNIITTAAPHIHQTSATSISASSKLRTPQKEYTKSSAQILVKTPPIRSKMNTTKTFAASPPPTSPLSSSGYTSIILAANSKEALSNPPTVQDTIEQRSALRNHKHESKELQGQERQGLLRSQSSPTASKHSTRHCTSNFSTVEEKEQLFQPRGVSFDKHTRFPATGSSSPNSSIKIKMKAMHQGPIDSMFATGAWEDMLRAYRLPDYKPSTLSRFKGSAPMIELSISDIKSHLELHCSKISGLVVMVKEVSLSEIDAAVTLLDPSGEMRGTVHRTVLDQYKNNEIRAGTVLALKNIIAKEEKIDPGR
ncbi:hypothetical protein BGX26_003941 [Mortierella sp. AD094]|nr:hypothetical protein BGX26_003941 [Mortierella sp. AD094]